MRFGARHGRSGPHGAPAHLVATPIPGDGKALNRRLTLALPLAVSLSTVLVLAAPAVALGAPEAPQTSGVSELSNTTARVEGVLNPGALAPAGWLFVYKQGAACTGGTTTPPHPEAEVEAQPVAATLVGLQPGSEYTACLVARNGEGETIGNPVSFTTGSEGPALEAETFSEVGSASATLRASIVTHGSPGTFLVEYGPTAEYGSATVTKALPANPATSSATVVLTGLQSESTYHFRFLVTTDLGSDGGPDASFSTLAPGLGGLPDGRVAEMVTPPNNLDAEAYVRSAGHLPLSEEDGIFTDLPFQASADGNAVAYVSSPTAGGNGSAGTGEGNEDLARRTGPGVWSAEAILPPAYVGPAYQAFSEDLSIGVLEADPRGSGEGIPALTPDAPTNTGVLYKRTGPPATYKAVFTATPTRELWTAGVPVENTGGNPIDFTGASADFAHILFEANGVLTANAVDGGEEVNNLYDSHAGTLDLVNVLPDGTSEPNATFGGPWQPVGETENAGPDLERIISTDGSRIYWTDLNAAHKNLYLRKNAGTPSASTVQVDRAVGGEGVFWTASATGEVAYFTRGDLYRYEAASDTTTDITPGAEVEGVLAASEDGDYVYFVSKASLAPGAEPQTCDQSPANDATSLCNLYVYRHGQPLHYIAALQASDGNAIFPFGISGGNRENGDWIGSLGHRTAETTPNGQSLVFMSSRSLTGYESDGYSEVYLFNVDRGISCVSCDPTGEPASTSTLSDLVSAAGFVPISWTVAHRLRWMSDDGARVFFDSRARLVPEDQNDRQDVYEWERQGAAGCSRIAGCLYLLSGGSSTASSWLLDVSATGDDAFVITRARLAPQDQNENYDVYDLRVGGAAQAPTVGCVGLGCRPELTQPPSFSTPSTLSSIGPGNLAPPSASPLTRAKPKPKPRRCKRGYIRHRGKCVKAHQRRRAHKTHRRGSRVAHRRSAAAGLRAGGNR